MSGILNYELRPSKQIERKIILEILNELRFLNYHISGYRYVGMPSVFYYDFILFYKYLYIEDMIGFESKAMLKRMEYNKPYDFIKIIPGEFSSSFKKTHFSKKSILWLDYTTELNINKLENISDITGNYLKPGSIIIITVPNIYPIKEDEAKLKFRNRLSNFGDYLSLEGEINDINKIDGNNLSTVYYKSVKSCIDLSLKMNKDTCQTIPLFNIRYADGVNMCSFGFLIDKKGKAEKVTSFLKKKRAEYCNDPSISYKISLPVLTNKERRFLDQMCTLLKSELLTGNPIEHYHNIEINDDEVSDYLKHSKHNPNYYETII